MITEKEVEEAVHKLIDGAEDIAKAKADLIYAEEYKKSIKAMIMKDGRLGNMPISAQEREAVASEEYKKQLEKIRDCTLNYEKLRAERVGLEAMIEFWRSRSANERAVKL